MSVAAARAGFGTRTVMWQSTSLETILKRDRAIVLVHLVGVTALAWLYLMLAAAEMGESMTTARMVSWTPLDFAFTFMMWAIMMVGMMVPSAAPVILLYARFCRTRRDQPFAPTGVFAAGYLAAWTGFSLAATALQWRLEEAALLSPMMMSTGAALAGPLLIAAGVYQFTPLKHACLRHCRWPIHFLSTHWRDGTGGALVMGLQHGAYCVGCCWFLMGLLFVGGVMNLLWVAAIAILVGLEKLLPFGARAGRVLGGLLVLAGLFAIVGA